MQTVQTVQKTQKTQKTQKMNKFYFVIDSRESKLLATFGEKKGEAWEVKDSYKKYVQFNQLPVGDVIFYDTVDSVPTPVVVIERKEIKDLSGCIYSGSYKEQKLRLLKYQAENPTARLIYLVENFSISKMADLNTVANKGAPPKQRKTIKVLLSSIVSTMLRDDFYVMTTQGFDGTVAFIERIYDKWPSYRAEIQKRKTDIDTEYLKNLKVTKKENLTTENWYLRSLMCIHGVSTDKANHIAKVYPNFGCLIEAYKALSDESDREKMLKDVSCGSRKLGPVCSKKVYNHIRDSGLV